MAMGAEKPAGRLVSSMSQKACGWITLEAGYSTSAKSAKKVRKDAVMVLNTFFWDILSHSLEYPTVKPMAAGRFT
jgi:hypothetical protein